MSRGSGGVDLIDATSSTSVRSYLFTTLPVAVRQGDVAPGEAFTARVFMSVSGELPPAQANSLTLTVKDGAGRAIRTITVDAATVNAGGTVDVAVAHTTTYLGTGEASAGTVEFDLRATRTSVGSYDVSSDNRGTQTPPTGVNVQRNRAWVRANTTLTTRTLRDSDGALPPQSLLVFGEAPRLVAEFGHPVFDPGASMQLTLLTSAGGSYGSGFASWGGITRRLLATVLAALGSAYTAARFDGSTVSVVMPNHPASGVSGMAATTTTQEPINTDPRLTLRRLMQHDDNAFGTPPTVKDEGGTRLTSQLSFLSTRVLNARTEGVNGVSLSRSLRDVKGLTPAKTLGAEDTTTVGGEAGWLPTFLVWGSDQNLPGGTWFVTHATSGSATGMFDTLAMEHTLISADPSLRLVAGAGPAGVADDRHFTPGVPLLVGATCLHARTRKQVPLDVGSVHAIVCRFHLATGLAQYLDADLTWKALSADTAAYAWPLTSTQDSPNVHTRTFDGAVTAAWGVSDIFVVGTAAVGGVPVTSTQKEITTNGVNNHDKYQFDALAFLGIGGER